MGELTDDNTLQEMIERADFDADGLVSEEEFYNLLTKKAYWLIKMHILYFVPNFQKLTTKLQKIPISFRVFYWYVRPLKKKHLKDGNLT